MPVLRRNKRRIAWSIAVLAAVGVVGLALVRWPGSVLQRLAKQVRPTSSRLADALVAYRQGDWKQAADLSRPLLKTAADDPEVLRTYARASARLERDAVAYAIYNDRLGVDRMLTEDLFLLGIVLVRADKLGPALEVWKRGARVGADHPELLDHLARLSTQFQYLVLRSQVPGVPRSDGGLSNELPGQPGQGLYQLPYAQDARRRAAYFPDRPLHSRPSERIARPRCTPRPRGRGEGKPCGDTRLVASDLLIWERAVD
jgi:hypothetical protein